MLSVTKDIGRLYENLVFLQLRRKFKEIFYFKQNQEVDFCFYNADKKIELINVCFSLSDNSAKVREMNGLQEAMSALNIDYGILINNNLEEDLMIGNTTIKIIPLWKWLTKFKTY